MDPPWKYGGSGGTKWRPASEYYPVMEYSELCDMKKSIDDISADNSLIFMWATGPTLPMAINLGKHFGFKYITVAFVWYKQRANVGNYTMSSCEYCLLFKKGKIPNGRVRNPGQKQFISAPVTIHSEKPNEARERISAMFPIAKKVELFARNKTQGWYSWGLDINPNGDIEQ